jgi:hypothetical protein
LTMKLMQENLLDNYTNNLNHEPTRSPALLYGVASKS